MQTVTRVVVLILIILMAVFAFNNMEWVQITLPGLQVIQVRLATAAVIFFTIGFLTASAWLSIGMVRRYFTIRTLKRRIQELETRIPPVVEDLSTSATFDKKFL